MLLYIFDFCNAKCVGILSISRPYERMEHRLNFIYTFYINQVIISFIFHKIMSFRQTQPNGGI